MDITVRRTGLASSHSLVVDDCARPAALCRAESDEHARDTRTHDQQVAGRRSRAMTATHLTFRLERNSARSTIHTQCCTRSLIAIRPWTLTDSAKAAVTWSGASCPRGVSIGFFPPRGVFLKVNTPLSDAMKSKSDQEATCTGNLTSEK